ncbi:MAG: RHS repeat-associated core domain-containing protein [Deltaproteobacteria bacterium]|nr:RHS repeat-associated core domain-containing protein [Deltaproteobacteria bacterium]
MAETNAVGNITAKYIYGIGLLARVDTNGTNYYHYDSLGSAIALTDESGAVTDQYAYDEFGSIANRGGYSENPFTFVGQYGLMDEGNGIYFVRARYYDSKTGRFLNKDLITGVDNAPQTLHRFVYALNSPVGLVDLTGFCADVSGVDSWWYRWTTIGLILLIHGIETELMIN